jgi:hypothetical protein
MLRDLERNFRCALHALREGGDQAADVAIAAHGSEAAAGFIRGRADPAKHHLTVAPALDVARVVRDQSVQVFDGIGTFERLKERAPSSNSLEPRGQSGILIESTNEVKCGITGFLSPACGGRLHWWGS